MRNERGFTLAELLVVVAVLALMLTGVLALQRQGQLAYILGSNRVESQQNARVALTLMTREIREACSITSLTSSAIQFRIVDPTKDGSVDCSSPTPGDVLEVGYRLGAGGTASTLLRLFANAGAPLPAPPADCSGTNAQYCVVGGVESLSLGGYDSAGGTTTTPGASCGPGAICSVSIIFRAKSEDTTGYFYTGSTRTDVRGRVRVEGRVRLRNII